MGRHRPASLPAMSVLRRALRRAGPLAALLAAEAAGVGALHALGGQPWAHPGAGGLAGWAGAPPVEALMAALRLAGLAVGWWLLATTTLAGAAALGRAGRSGRRRGHAGAERLAAGVRPLTLPLVRRAADRAAAAGVSVALAIPAGAAAADEPLPPPALSEPAAVEPADRGGAAGSGAREPAGERVHEVAVGEHLWGIAAADLAARRGVAESELAEAEIRARWQQVVAANAERLRSGDPDLIHPGERIALPPP